MCTDITKPHSQNPYIIITQTFAYTFTSPPPHQPHIFPAGSRAS